MRTKAAVLGSLLLVLGLVLPSASWARREVVIGSLAVAKPGGVALTTELVGLAIIANPGWEKMIVQQLPPFTIPVVLDAERDDGPGLPGPARKLLHTDTVVMLTNTTASALDIELTVRDGTGALLVTQVHTLDPHSTRVLLLSDELP
jgi:hypothetical protein